MANKVEEQKTEGLKIIKSACHMCHGGCGTLVHVKEGKVVKIAGDPESPLSKGKLCPKGMASIEHLYHPNRLKYPMKRAGKRGEGKWKRILWDEALGTIAGKVSEIKDEYGIESVAVGMGTGRHHYLHVPRFVNALGTPNWCEPGSAQCFIPRVVSCLMTYGGFLTPDYYSGVNPECILVWGHNPVVSGPDGEIQFLIKERIRNGSRLIVVDPRKSQTANHAELWLQIRPGTDDALALGMMNVMISESLYDREFVEKWTVGFDRLKERTAEYPLERVERITWVPAEKIQAAARLFAQASPATLEWGVALEHTPNCLQTIRAIGILPAITGNIDIPGGFIFGMNVVDNVDVLMENLNDDMKDKRMGAEQFKVLSGRDAMMPSAHIPTLFNAMRTGKPYPIKAFLSFGNNGLVTYSNSKEVYESFMSLDFYSVMDIYITPTAELADIVLPAATWLEIDQIVHVPLFINNVALAMKQITRIGESRSDEEVFVDLARRLNLEVGTDPVEDIYNKQLAPAGITFEEFKEKGCIVAPIRYRKYEENGFETASGKIELASSYMESLGYDPLPYYEEPPESPISTPEVAANFPLILITGARSQYFFHSEFRQISSLRKRNQDPIVEIHPETAQKQNIQDGDWVWIESPRGRIQQKAKLTYGIDPRVINIQHAWWFPEEKGPEYGVWKSNANVLTSNAPPYDPAMGTYQLRALLCKVYRVSATST